LWVSQSTEIFFNASNYILQYDALKYVGRWDMFSFILLDTIKRLLIPLDQCFSKCVARPTGGEWKHDKKGVTNGRKCGDFCAHLY